MPLYRKAYPRGYWYATGGAGSTLTTVNTVTETTIKFNIADIIYDPYAMLGVGTFQFTIPIDGYYHWRFNAGLLTNGVNAQYWAAIRSASGSNGTATYLGLTEGEGSIGSMWLSVSIIKPFKAGDVIYATFYNGSTTNQNSLNLANAASVMECAWLTPF